LIPKIEEKKVGGPLFTARGHQLETEETLINP